jgi:hypothetical protein
LQASRQFFGRAASVGLLSFTAFVGLPATAHAAGATGMELPVIELKAKGSGNATSTTSTTAAPQPSVTVVTIPTADVVGDASDGTSEEETAGTGSTNTDTNGAVVENDAEAQAASGEGEQLLASSSNEDLTSTGANTKQITGIAMLLTGIGLALLTFTNIASRTERAVRGLLPIRISGK